MAREQELVKALVGVRVLVVDADADARHLLEALLTYCGVFVTLAGSAREALDCMQDAEPDVVLIDVAMPQGDGYWLLREMQARARGERAAPAVALAAGRPHGPDRTLGAGFRVHLRKPVDPWELCRVVATLAHRA